MSGGSLSPGLQEFIARYVPSVEKVEILCLLSSEGKRAWSVAEVFRVIRSSEQSVAETLEVFAGQGLLEQEAGGGYRYGPQNPELGQRVEELRGAYRERRVTVVETIYGKPQDPLKDFADAFKFRKNK